MAGIGSVGDLTEDFGADLMALRDEITKLTSSVSAFVHSQSTVSAISMPPRKFDSEPGLLLKNGLIPQRPERHFVYARKLLNSNAAEC